MTEFSDPIVLEDHEVWVPPPVPRSTIEPIEHQNHVYDITAQGLVTPLLKRKHILKPKFADTGYEAPDERQVEICRRWLTKYTRPTVFREFFMDSYRLKHTIEGNGYVTNGALILASHRILDAVVPHGPLSINANFRIDLLPLDDPDIESLSLGERAYLTELHRTAPVDLNRGPGRPRKSGSKIRKKTRVGISPRIRFFILQRDQYRCQICGRTAANGAALEVDHKHPVALGGSDDLSNLWVLCDLCNRGKSSRLL